MLQGKEFDRGGGVLFAEAFLVFAQFVDVSGFERGVQEATDGGGGAGGVDDVDDGLLVVGSDFDGGVGFAGGGAAEQERDGKAFALHFAGDVGHFVKRRGDQSAEADDVDVVLAGSLEDFLAGNHDAEVDDFVVVAGQDDASDVFADVMDVAFDGGHEDFALGMA